MRRRCIDLAHDNAYFALLNNGLKAVFGEVFAAIDKDIELATLNMTNVDVALVIQRHVRLVEHEHVSLHRLSVARWLQF